MKEVGPSAQQHQGFSARSLTKVHGLPIHNKKLQNVEHGLALRDKIRIINYIQAKPRRKSSSSRPMSPVSPQFHSLAEELMSAAAAIKESLQPDFSQSMTHMKGSPSMISGSNIFSSHHVGHTASSKAQMSNSTMENTPKGTSVGCEPDDSHLKPKTTGFSARNLLVGDRTGSSKPSHVPLSGAQELSKSDYLELGSTAASKLGNSLLSFSQDTISTSVTQTPLTSMSNSKDEVPSPLSSQSNVFMFAPKTSPGTTSLQPLQKDSLKPSPRSNRARASSVVARQNEYNSKRFGLSSKECSPTPSNSSQSSDIDPDDLVAHASDQDNNNESKQADTTTLSKTSSQTLGFSARNPSPGLSSNVPQSQNFRTRTRHMSIPNPIATRTRHMSTPNLIATSTSPPITVNSKQAPDYLSGSQLSNLGSEHNQSITANAKLPIVCSNTPPPGFSARNPPPGLISDMLQSQNVKPKSTQESARNPPPGVISDMLQNQNVIPKSTQESARNPPPGFSLRDLPPAFSGTIVTTPPGFGLPPSGRGSKTAQSPTGVSPPITSPDVSDNFKSTSEVHFPGDLNLEAHELPTSPAEILNDSPNTNSVAATPSIGNSTVVRLARQQVHPYTQKKAPYSEKVKPILAAVVRAELDMIKKTHMEVKQLVPPTVNQHKSALMKKRTQSDPTKLDIVGQECVFNDDKMDIVKKNLPVKVCVATWKAIGSSHSMLISNSPKLFSFGVANICHMLQMHGKEMEQFNKKGMDMIFVTIRNLILDHSKKLQYRQQLLELLETRANKWVKRAKSSSKDTSAHQVVKGLPAYNASGPTVLSSLDNSAQVDIRKADATTDTTAKSNSRPRFGRSLSESDTNTLSRQFHSIRIKPPSPKVDLPISSSDKLSDSASGPTEDAKANIGCNSNADYEDNTDDLRSDEDIDHPVASVNIWRKQDMHRKKYTREFLLSCYDSPMTKQIPTTLQFTILNSDAGYIVDRNDEDPRDLINATHLPPVVKPYLDIIKPRDRRLLSCPNPTTSYALERTSKDIVSPPTPGILGAAPTLGISGSPPTPGLLGKQQTLGVFGSTARSVTSPSVPTQSTMLQEAASGSTTKLSALDQSRWPHDKAPSTTVSSTTKNTTKPSALDQSRWPHDKAPSTTALSTTKYTTKPSALDQSRWPHDKAPSTTALSTTKYTTKPSAVDQSRWPHDKAPSTTALSTTKYTTKPSAVDQSWWPHDKAPSTTALSTTKYTTKPSALDQSRWPHDKAPSTTALSTTKYTTKPSAVDQSRWPHDKAPSTTALSTTKYTTKSSALDQSRWPHDKAPTPSTTPPSEHLRTIQASSSAYERVLSKFQINRRP